MTDLVLSPQLRHDRVSDGVLVRQNARRRRRGGRRAACLGQRPGINCWCSAGGGLHVHEADKRVRGGRTATFAFEPTTLQMALRRVSPLLCERRERFRPAISLLLVAPMVAGTPLVLLALAPPLIVLGKPAAGRAVEVARLGGARVGTPLMLAPPSSIIGNNASSLLPFWIAGPKLTLVPQPTGISRPGTLGTPRMLAPAPPLIIGKTASSLLPTGISSHVILLRTVILPRPPGISRTTNTRSFLLALFALARRHRRLMLMCCSLVKWLSASGVRC